MLTRAFSWLVYSLSLPYRGASPPGPLSEKEMRIKHFSGEPIVSER